jgi:putative transposase
MKKSKFTEAQILFALKQAETGVKVEEVCRKMGISEATFFIWKKKYSGVGASDLRKQRQLEEENLHLKQLVADLSLDKQMLQDVLKKSLKDSPAKGAGLSFTDSLPGTGAPGLPGGDGPPLGLVL